ncbi:MAG: hypothetical protein Q8T08_17995 [Ignavibacteria bacterium]|jgi:hypothetical protein|nr:hypothetical protein [Ignavibacteria bacterium]
MPNNLFERFKIACRKNPADVLVEPKAVKDAREIYQLYTEKELLKFIGNDGLKNVRHLNITEWRNNPDKKNNPLDVYDYHCKTNGIPYYIAIIFIPTFFGKTINKWKLKSFHLPDDANLPMFDQLAKLSHSPLEDNDE